MFTSNIRGTGNISTSVTMVYVIINSEREPIVVKRNSNRVTTKESHPGAHVSKSVCSMGNVIRAKRPTTYLQPNKSKKALPFHLASFETIFYCSELKSALEKLRTKP